MKRILFALIVSAGFSAAAFCEPSTIAISHEAAFDETRLLRIDAAIERAIDTREIPGAVAIVVKDDEIVYRKKFGFADVAAKAPMQDDSIFRIASMTKAITTVAVMQLYERGNFLLNDPVSTYIPWFANPRIATGVDEDGNVTDTIAATKEIRIMDLLTHTSGIAYPFIPSKTSEAYKKAGIIDGLTEKQILLEANVRRIAEQPLLAEPGSKFDYGLDTDVLGYLVEVISGKSLDTFFKEEVFQPLGMHDTYFYLPDSKAARLVTLYADATDSGIAVSSGKEGDILLDNPRYPVEGAKEFFSGGAGLSSTASDYVRFLRMLLGEGALDGVRILSKKSVALMTASRVDMDGDGDPDFSLGFKVIDALSETDELGTKGSYAWGGAFNTSYWVDPEERMIGVFMSQVRPTKGQIRNQFRVLVYQALN